MKPYLQKQTIYCIYVRNHTEEGTFKAIEQDIPRIKELGVDIIWFMPIHPIGIEGKKGSLGCPYANKDYRSINPCYGNITDFTHLVDVIHENGMKCIIDVVYNHTSPDSTLVQEHPEYFFYRNGKRANKVGDWSDVVDLDYTNKELWNYQIESLQYWASIVDGFRCDVASFIPLDFWNQAKEEVSKVNPDCIWLAETVHQSFGQIARSEGIYSEKDINLYEAFDTEYEYDIRECFEKYLNNETTLSNYVDLLNYQEASYPIDYNKMRFLENHDTKRFITYVNAIDAYVNYLAFLYFNKGTTQIYAGQEYLNDFTPSLFEKDVINRNTGFDISNTMQTLSKVKKDVLDEDDIMMAQAYDADILKVIRRNKDSIKIGIFSLKAKDGVVKVELEDGTYLNYIDQTMVEVQDGTCACNGKPIILKSNTVKGVSI